MLPFYLLLKPLEIISWFRGKKIILLSNPLTSVEFEIEKLGGKVSPETEERQNLLHNLNVT